MLRSRNTNTKLTEAARRLLTDQDFLDAFRRDPVRATAPLQLSTDEVDALKSGNDDDLVRLGADIRSLQVGGRPRFARTLRTIGRVAPGLAATALALGVWAAPSHADSKAPGGARGRAVLRRAGRARRRTTRLAGSTGARARRVTARTLRASERARRRASKRTHRAGRAVRALRVRAVRTVRSLLRHPPSPAGPPTEVPFRVG